MTAIMCTHYCSHGARCALAPGHKCLHSASPGDCRWPDTESITREEADRILARTPAGREFLGTRQPFADLIERLAENWP
jgi:NAD(P)-dependent dehydrogenase (short-subunit alcohol dehydrogenase family)